MEERRSILALKNITKGLYDISGKTINKNVIVLKSVNFDIRPGEVHVFLGENGAGKSTLMKILCGAVPADSGSIYYNGAEVSINNPHIAHELGVGLVAQEFSLFPNLTVAQNIFLGREPVKGRWGTIDQVKLAKDAAEQLARLKIEIDITSYVRDLTVAQQQMVEIAKALSLNPKVLILDEPTSALADDQVEQLFDVIRTLTQKGVSIIYITHKLNEVLEIGDRVTVLRDGQTVGTEEVAQISDMDNIVQMMVGQKLENLFQRSSIPPGEMAIEVKSLQRKGVLEDINLHVHCGEIVGLAGIVGAGRTELARAIFGADPYDAGEIRVFGKAMKASSPIQSITHGIGFLPEDRARQGIVPLCSVMENINHVVMLQLAWKGWIGKRRRRDVAAKYVQDLSIVVSSLQQDVRYLSGGNQQKVVLAKWLSARSKMFIFDEPTRGIDVGVKAAIYALMDELTRRGAAILMISSELPEIIGMSDRIYVMREGKIVAEMKRGAIHGEEILRYAMGGHDIGS
ncbi:ribose import ATP-binding protein RbsA 1 [Candidatus Vecturithrix granuli]|uniref:Ribose import ATP-binding protein RbsA 1 n=1 Tax=Vecturithrix granuli TaxID=1499967 RepID=A0A081CAX0_VECG1|nr:ribose import ATP-binding protein RbsA 1 [Candidatus Vecturithrix granuli]